MDGRSAVYQPPGPEDRVCSRLIGPWMADQPCKGAEEDRTPNLGIANAALSQLSYRPG